MDLFNEIDDLSDLYLLEKNTKLDSATEEYEDLQSKYSNLHENYAKEMENSKKVEKCLVKCLKFYSKLCKKYEVQQKIISNLEENIREKVNILEEAQKNEERMKGLIQVYRTERSLYSAETNSQLKKDKEVLLDICCKLIIEPLKNHNIRNMINLLLRKFKNDLDDEVINLLKEIKNSNFKITQLESIPKSPSSSECVAPVITLKDNSFISTQNFDPSRTEEFVTQPKNSYSFFDIPDVCLNYNNSEEQTEKQSTADEENELFSDVLSDERENKLDYLSFVNNTNNMNLDLVNSEEQATFPYERKLFKIFREMSSMRLLSPIRENTDSLSNSKTSSVVLSVNKDDDFEKSQLGTKRNSEADENSCRNKKLKPEEEASNCNLLDSILSAMSIQNEEFKSKGVSAMKLEASPEIAEGCPRSEFEKKIFKQKKKLGKGISKENSLLVRQSSREIENGKQSVDKKLVTDEIKNFVSSPISSKEDADKAVRHCLSVLSNKSEDLIAKCIVGVVLENVDEAVEIFERPSPPLTKTQHRLIVLVSVIRTLDLKFENISNKILSIIWEKLFPDNFFWPDDSVETASRFYAALCRVRNDSKTLWKFCLHAMTDMRQRCPLLMFTVLKTWPDILHDASTLKNNMLAVTVVNIFLHMPKKEGFRNFNQGKKLIALKHLLMNFYQFKVEDSIENYTKKVFDAVCMEEIGAKKSMVLLSKCKDKNWTIKNVVPMMKSKLVDWFEERVEDSVGNRILSVMKQICPILQEDRGQVKIKETVSCLSEILTSAKKNHDCEVNIVEVLLQLKQFPEVRKVIREWIPKKPISDHLRSEIINVSADSILRELKLNRKKEAKNITAKKSKKHLRKSKVKKKKIKKSKMNMQNSKVGLAQS